MITYEEFLEKCKSLTEGDCEISYWGILKKENRTRYSADNYPQPISWRDKKDYDDVVAYLYVETETGGVSGGSCWDSSDPQPYYRSDPEKELVVLDLILEEYCPNISHLKYKNLYRTLVKEDSRTVYEYYGNETTYSYKKIDTKALFDYMLEHELLK